MQTEQSLQLFSTIAALCSPHKENGMFACLHAASPSFFLSLLLQGFNLLGPHHAAINQLSIQDSNKTKLVTLNLSNNFNY